MVSLQGHVVLAVAVPMFVIAAMIQRFYIADGRMFLLIAALVLFTIGNALMVLVMRDMGLGVAISIATIAQLILVNIIAYALFEERPAPMQLAGIALGVVSMILILMPRGSG
jgi:glucose uptake protein